MAQRGPLVTAVVVVGGLIGLMTANAAGGLVTAAGPSPTPAPAGATQTETPATEVPQETTTAPPAPANPPVNQTTEPPNEAPPPAGPQFPAEAVYAGAVDDAPLTVAIAVKGEEASAYICDGAAVETWLKGTAKDGSVDLASADGGSTLTATLDNDALVGTVAVGAQSFDFDVTVAPPPAGLYRGENGETTVGWIILQDGTQVGVARTGSRSMPAPMLKPSQGGVTIAGKRVAAEKVNGETAFG
jgi:hypothetical protein